MVENLPVKSRIGFGVLAAAIGSLLGWLLYQGSDAQLGDPSLRILWQLIKATFAGCVLLVGCILLFRKRARRCAAARRYRPDDVQRALGWHNRQGSADEHV